MRAFTDVLKETEETTAKKKAEKETQRDKTDLDKDKENGYL